MQSMLSELKGICIVDRKPKPRAERYKDLKGVKLTEEKFVQRQSEHPLVCTHPEPVRNPCYQAGIHLSVPMGSRIAGDVE